MNQVWVSQFVATLVTTYFKHEALAITELQAHIFRHINLVGEYNGILFVIQQLNSTFSSFLSLSHRHHSVFASLKLQRLTNFTKEYTHLIILIAFETNSSLWWKFRFKCFSVTNDYDVTYAISERIPALFKWMSLANLALLPCNSCHGNKAALDQSTKP